MGEESSRCILNQLEFIDGCVADAIEEGVAIVKAGGDEGVDEFLCSRRCEGGTELCYVA